ncbi:MAG: hypothetical protein ACLPKE_20710, partial [Streptosporangiaceae bacterium]
PSTITHRRGAVYPASRQPGYRLAGTPGRQRALPHLCVPRISSDLTIQAGAAGSESQMADLLRVLQASEGRGQAG